MVCWCETNDKDKTTAIANAEASITSLTALIEELTGLSARLQAEIGTLNTEVAENSEALDKATGIREKELAEFTANEGDMLASISSLGNAVTTLSKHNSLLQAEDIAAIHHTMKKHASAVGNMLLPSQKRTLTAFVQSPEDFLAGDASFAQSSGPQNAGSYAPQSGAIFGVLKNMKESFEANLAAAQKEESDSERAYRELKAAKESEIAAGSKQIETKTIQMGNAEQKKAESRQNLEDTTNTMEADQEFLGKLKEHCALADAEMEARTKERTEEIAAVGKAMAILTSDDAHDLFTKTLGFVQKESTVISARRTAVAKVLLATHKPKLAAIATAVKLDNFGKVKDTLDKMITDLTKEKEDEIALKDWCYDEIRKNERTTEMTDRTKEGLVAKIDDLSTTIDELTKAIKGLNDDIAEMQVQLKRASEDREGENTIFQQTVADQKATAALLTKALNVLKATYDKKASLLQRNAKKATQPAGPPPPPGFGGYKKNAQSGGVMGMIEMIINDANAMEAEATKDEISAQQAYEDFVTETNNAITAARQEIMNKTNDKAKAEGDKTETEVELDSTMDELEQLAKENMDLHGECDYTIKHFDTRQTSRDSEIEALKQSVAILSGAAAMR